MIEWYVKIPFNFENFVSCIEKVGYRINLQLNANVIDGCSFINVLCDVVASIYDIFLFGVNKLTGGIELIYDKITWRRRRPVLNIISMYLKNYIEELDYDINAIYSDFSYIYIETEEFTLKINKRTLLTKIVCDSDKIEEIINNLNIKRRMPCIYRKIPKTWKYFLREEYSGKE
ncbi:MAG TPA: hypothetical protein PKN66_09490 [Thermodesulfovibrio thiophilus]|nr:hypothetical protein [Thermodesulfovibrio thiophilus]